MTPTTARFLDDLQELLDDERFLWAADKLAGIQATVRRSDQVTEGQRQAVANITAGRRDGLPSEKYRSSRRYENWAPSR